MLVLPTEMITVPLLLEGTEGSEEVFHTPLEYTSMTLFVRLKLILPFTGVVVCVVGKRISAARSPPVRLSQEKFNRLNPLP